MPLQSVHHERILLYTDATGKGGVGWVVIDGDEHLFSAAWVPNWLRRRMLPRRTQVASWELVALLCALWVLISRCAGRNVEIHCFVDSMVAKGTLLRGASKQADWNALVTELWFQIAAHNIAFAGWHVPSALNMADAPSRMFTSTGAAAIVQTMGLTEMEWQWPKHWIDLPRQC